MAIDLYQPCPCGSGKKFKWCCQPVYVQIDKAFQQDAKGQHETALRMMDEVCAEHSGNPEVWGRKAQLLYQMDRVEDAENALQKAFDINSNYPFGQYLRGRFRHFEGEIPGALLLFRKAVEAYDPAAHTILAQIYSLITECELKLNRPVAARAAMEMAAKQEPANPDYKAGIEEVFGAKSRFPEVARKEYSYLKLADNAPAQRQAAWQGALQTAAIGKLGDALKAFEQLTAEDGEDAAVWFNLGLTKAWLGDNTGALGALDRSVQLDHDEERAAGTWALAEVLLCGHGLEDKADFVEHSAVFPIRNPEQLFQVLQRLQADHRLIGTQVRQEEGMLTGVMVEKVQALTAEHAASRLSRVGAYLLVVGDMLRLWNVNKLAFDAVVQELRQMTAGTLAEPHLRVGPANFADVLVEGLGFPSQAMDEAESSRRMRDFFQTFMEEKWIHRPLPSLSQVPPVDAVGHTTLRIKLKGLILFLADCAAAIGSTYDFERLRRKLGLLGDVGNGKPAVMRDFSAMGAAEMAALDLAALSDGELYQVFESALKLGAQEIAGKFAKAVFARPPQADKPDRYPLFNLLIQAALAEGNTDVALEYVNVGEQADREHNEGRRGNDYEQRRGQIYIKRGEISKAAEVFDRLIERAPNELRFRGSAAEAMLAAKQPAKALAFAEGGLKKSREQNNRDSEQYFMELSAASRKQA
jgi:tetratricopeptide (TPR) repeat protein